MARRFLLSNTSGRIAIPSLGLGTYLLKNGDGKAAIDSALFHGYRHIDTARRYRNEEEIGDVVQSRIRTGKLKRNGLFLTTKIPSTSLAKEDVQPCLEESMEALKTNYVDMLLIHHPWGLRNRGNGEYNPVNERGERELEEYDLNETWQAMEELVDSGKVRAIGLSNFSIRLIDKIWNKAKIKPSNLQCECHVYLQQRELLDYCRTRGIIMTAYSPFGTPALPVRLPNQPVPLDDEMVQVLARKYERTTGQILLRHLLQKGIVVIPKSSNEKRIKENSNIYDFDIAARDMQKLNSLDSGLKFYVFEWAWKHSLFIESEAF